MTDPIAAYRATVIAAHRPAFDLFTEVAGVLEAAAIEPRDHPHLAHWVLDMFMLQALNSYAAVALLAQHGLMEDAATISRRLMELAVQAVYVGAESEEELRERKAGKYPAFLWRQLTPKQRRTLPRNTRAFWISTARKYARSLAKKATTWGPNWRDMFREIGAEATYLADYTYLAGIAHGRPETQIFTFSRGTIRARDHKPASVILAYATRYCLIVAEQWNGRFDVFPDGRIKGLIGRAIAFRPRPRP